MIRFAIYCGSRDGMRPAYREAASALGRALAARNVGIVYGGATVGLMGAVASSAMEAGGDVIGVMPRALAHREITARSITTLIETETMHERKQRMIDEADGFIALPGGPGTLEELFEVFTWMKIGLHRKPIGLLNIDGYYDGLITFLQHMVEEGFMSEEELTYVIISHEVDHFVAQMINRMGEL